MINVKKLIFTFFSLVGLSIFLLIWFLVLELSNRDLKLYFFAVGQGDALLISSPNHFNILIDGGPDNTVLYKLGRYLPFYDRTIDLMILTHPHADHVTGLVEVLQRYWVKTVFATGVKHHLAAYTNWLATIQEKNINFFLVQQRQVIDLAPDLKLEILFPNQDFSAQNLDNLNNSSIVIALIYGQTKIILTGDFEKEESLVGENFNLAADLLKVGHHGSANANSWQFLSAVQPQYAVISVGVNNHFGHPHSLTLDRLKNLGTKVFRTDQVGDIIFFSNGQELLPVTAF